MEDRKKTFSIRYRDLQGAYSFNYDHFFTVDKDLMHPFRPIFEAKPIDETPVDAARSDVQVIYSYYELMNARKGQETAIYLAGGESNPNYFPDGTGNAIKSMRVTAVWDKSERTDISWILEKDELYFDTKTFLIEIDKQLTEGTESSSRLVNGLNYEIAF